MNTTDAAPINPKLAMRLRMRIYMRFARKQDFTLSIYKTFIKNLAYFGIHEAIKSRRVIVY